MYHHHDSTLFLYNHLSINFHRREPHLTSTAEKMAPKSKDGMSKIVASSHAVSRHLSFHHCSQAKRDWLFSFALFYRQIKSSTSIISKKYQREKEEMPPWRYFVGSRRRQRLFFSKLDSCTEQYRWILISSIGTGMTAFLRHESWS